MVKEAIQFISGLEFTLTKGLPQEKLVALRQSIGRIHVNKTVNKIHIQIREVPTGNLRKFQEIDVPL